MDNNNLKNNQPKTGLDSDGNLQVRSSGARTPARTPARVPAPAPAKPGARKRPARVASGKPASPAKAPTPKENVKEYSFATSALFNNDPKDRATDATAVSEAKKITGTVPTPQNGTRVMSSVSRPRRAQRDKTGAGQPARGGQTPQPPRAEPQKRQPPSSAARKNPVPPTAATQQRRAVQGQTPTQNKDALSATRVNPAVKGAPRRPVKEPSAQRGLAKDNPIAKIGSTFSAMNSVTRSLIYIAAVMLVSILLSWFIITNANDIFAFVKDEKTVSITIEPGTDLAELAELLDGEGIIQHKNTFKFFIKFRNKDSDSYAPGTYTVSSTMSYDQIISAITPQKTREMVRITVPEGYTVDEIIALFVDKGIGDREEFIRVINEGDFSDYWFVNELPEDTDRYYRLEGYLFPDTYYFYTDMTEDTIIRKFLDNFESKFTDEYREYLAKTENPLTGKPFTVDEIVTLGSIIQSEGKEMTVIIESEDGSDSPSYVDYGLISSVFHNRMELSTPMKLQSDATTQFALNMEGKTDAKLSDYTDADYTNPYNTYYCDGLPPGAICNPGLNAISFALFPDYSQYYYFVSDDSGNTYFSKTVEEHLATVNSLK